MIERGARVLVTGATGFLGRRLCARLAKDGAEVVALGSRDADLTRADSLDRFASARFDFVVHLAAWTQAGEFCLRHPGEQWVINQRINVNVLDWWARSQPQAKLVATGTSCAYDPRLPLTEDNYLLGEPIESLHAYAMTKRMLYVGQRALEKQYQLRHLTLVPSTLYGSDYHDDGRQPHFIFDLVRKFLRAKLHGEPVVLWGDGAQRRELVHVDDFVEATVRLAGATTGIVNVGGSGDHSIREFAELLAELVGFAAEDVVYDETRYVGARAKRLDGTKLASLLPDLRWTDLRAGLAETISWMRGTRAVQAR